MIAWPMCVRVDPLGRLLIADTNNQRIRRIATNGVITTIAGTGASTFSGDGGPATSAALSMPKGVCGDASGNFYIGDSNNSRIRKVTSSGTIATFAGNGVISFSGDGGQATSAALYYPQGVCLDGGGNLFIADVCNYRIRKVSTSGVIGTVAGNGTPTFAGDGGPATSASLWDPFEIALDATGQMFIADTYNHRIRKVDTAGIITTIAGTGAIGYSGDGGPGTSAMLNYPKGVAVDSQGYVFIADFQNSRVRRVSPSGTIVTVGGTGVGGYSGDGGAATSAMIFLPTSVSVDSAGNCYLADWYNQRIRILWR